MSRVRAAGTIEIRRADTQHAGAVATVLKQAFAEYASQYTAAAYAATAPDADTVLLRIQEGPTWIAIRGGQIVGAASAVGRSAGLYLRGMAVAPAAAGVGIGRLLLEQIERFAAAEGVTRLFLSTTPFLKRAIALYERFGFRISNEGPFELAGTPIFTMQKRLADPSAAREGPPSLPERPLLRRATAADIDLLVEHRCRMFREMGHSETASLNNVREWSRPYFEEALRSNLYRGWFACAEGGAVLGGAGLLLDSWPGTPDSSSRFKALILNVYVEPSARRRGIARFLMEALIAHCRAEGFASVSLHSSDSTRHLYHSLGFQPTTELKLRLSGCQ